MMRLAAPAFGTVLTADGCLLIAAAVLAAWFRFAAFDLQWRVYWTPSAAIGLVNLALPSLLYAFALRHIPASNGAVLNSTAPMSGALLGALLRLTTRLHTRLSGSGRAFRPPRSPVS